MMTEGPEWAGHLPQPTIEALGHYNNRQLMDQKQHKGHKSNPLGYFTLFFIGSGLYNIQEIKNQKIKH